MNVCMCKYIPGEWGDSKESKKWSIRRLETSPSSLSLDNLGRERENNQLTFKEECNVWMYLFKLAKFIKLSLACERNTKLAETETNPPKPQISPN